MSASKIKELLDDPRISVFGIFKGINKEGMSRSSFLNKLNDNHKHILKDEDVELVAEELRNLSKDILEKLK